MKTSAIKSVVQLSEKEMRALVTEVKETVYTEFEFGQTAKPGFSFVDMWNIRRTFKSAGDRIRK